MFNWHDFDVVFQAKPDYSFDNKTAEGINKHRREAGELFFDRIWRSIGLTRPSRNNYPPRTNQDLRNIWSKIVQSSAPDEQKLALLFYLLRDCRHLSNADSNFARRTYLPQKYQLLVAGLWELDHGQFSRALEHLTDPSLTPTFADDILFTLLQHPKCDRALASAYYIAVSPPLKDPKTLGAYFSLLLRNNMVEAYYFAKRQDHLQHKKLFEELIVTMHQENPSPDHAQRAAIVVGLPLTSEEDGWFEECLLDGAGSKLPGAKDSVIVRRIALGRSTSDISSLNRLGEEDIDGVNWDYVKTGISGTVPH